jgi:2-polyprenyl-3-methyl-5-hydroxy-6-metoxy-1,4-benzoquinol methylase
MRFSIAAADLPTLHEAMPRLAPWMHPFQLGPQTYTGYFKWLGFPETYWTPASPGPALTQTQQAFEDYMQGRPYHHMEALLERLGPSRGHYTALDIASATGRYSFYLAAHGLGQVTGVEIRPEQVEQAQLIQRLAPELATKPLQFVHDPTSADDPTFRAGESYDVVLSMGLLYHLANPVQHILNLSRLTQRVLVLKTLIHRRFAKYWQLVLEDASFITKATQGISWIGHYSQVAELLRQAGFSRVESSVPYGLEAIADAFDLTPKSNLGVYWDDWQRRLKLKPSIAAYAQGDKMRYGGHNPYYFTYIAYK